ncbi:FecR family protein [Ekhidna lutea]|uniref:FecR family protein n=1 Tax=Ekhidna lutea TaxID=447679 RepID=A0A239M2M9_EKHLU|nr:FecR domain-containing protein [Ekhidna lutea]SNT36925.1 FecR family protein [Ekhidna lutea]
MSDLDKYRKVLNHESDEVNDSLSEFLKKAANARVPEGKGKDEIWANIDDRISNESQEKKVMPIWRYISVAASLLIIATFAFLYYYQESPAKSIEVNTTIAESRMIELPDGSTVSLNANSSISYSEEWNRELQLSGEAFFEVEKGDKFIVKTSIGSVEVLGTSFNVFARDSTFEVACKTGKVRVDVPSKAVSEQLSPGQSIRLEKDTVKRTSLDTELVGKWQAGEFYFNEQRLSDVLNEVERQFDVTITLSDSSDHVFSGYFTNKNIESALDMVCLPLGLTYEKTEGSTYTVRQTE